MFSDREWAALISKLRQLTELGKVDWQFDGISDLILTLGNARYHLSARDSDDQPPWRLSVFRLGSEGPGTVRYVDSIDAVYSDESSLIPGSLVGGLRDIAYRMALGGPQLASDLLDDLLKIDPTDPPTFNGAPF